MLLNSFLHQRGNDCTSQSGKTESGGRHGFIIKFAFPPFIVHLIKKKKKSKEKSKAHPVLVSQSQQKRKISLWFVSCCYFHMTTWVTQVRGPFQFCVGAQCSGKKQSCCRELKP